MAISVAWQTVATVTASSVSYFTTPTATATTFGYARDLVLCNSGTALISVAVSASATSAATASSFAIPAGGTVILTQCQVPVSSIVYAIGPGALSIGYATNVAYI